MASMLSTFIQALMGAEADAVCGAGHGQRSAVRGSGELPQRYRHRDFDTRAGTIDVAIPKLRQGSYFPDWLQTTTQAGREGPDIGRGDVLPPRVSTQRFGTAAWIRARTRSWPRTHWC